MKRTIIWMVLVWAGGVGAAAFCRQTSETTWLLAGEFGADGKLVLPLLPTRQLRAGTELYYFPDVCSPDPARRYVLVKEPVGGAYGFVDPTYLRCCRDNPLSCQQCGSYPPDAPYDIDTSDPSYKPTVCVVTRTHYNGERTGSVECRGNTGAEIGPFDLVLADVDQFTEDGVTPTGWYLIGSLRTNFDCVPWFNLVQPSQDSSEWLTDWSGDENPYGRGQIGLHPGHVSHGCITVLGEACPPTTDEWDRLSGLVESGYVDMEWSFTTYRGFLCVKDVTPDGNTEFQAGCSVPSVGAMFGYAASPQQLFSSQFRMMYFVPKRASNAKTVRTDFPAEGFEADMLAAFPGVLSEITTVDVTPAGDGTSFVYYYGSLEPGVLPDDYLAALRSQLDSSDSSLLAGAVTGLIVPSDDLRLCEPVDTTTMFDATPCAKFDGCHFMAGELCGDIPASSSPVTESSSPVTGSSTQNNPSTFVSGDGSPSSPEVATLLVSRIGESANLLITVVGDDEAQLKLLLKKVCASASGCYKAFASSHSRIELSGVCDETDRSWFTIAIVTDDGLEMVLTCSLWKIPTVAGDISLPAGAFKLDYTVHLDKPLAAGETLSVRVGLEAAAINIRGSGTTWSLETNRGAFSVAFAGAAEVDGVTRSVGVESGEEDGVIFVDLTFPSGASFVYDPSVFFVFDSTPVVGASARTRRFALVGVGAFLAAFLW